MASLWSSLSSSFSSCCSNFLRPMGPQSYGPSTNSCFSNLQRHEDGDLVSPQATILTFTSLASTIFKKGGTLLVISLAQSKTLPFRVVAKLRTAIMSFCLKWCVVLKACSWKDEMDMAEVMTTKGNTNPEKCLDKGQQVTRCVLSLTSVMDVDT